MRLQKTTSCNLVKELQKATGGKIKSEMTDHRSNCPINLAVEVMGDKWTLLILRDIMFGGCRHFRELLQSEEGIASNILADRLAMLEREGILTKSPDPGHKQKFVYKLTVKGIDLLPVIKEIGSWSLQHTLVDKAKYPHAVQLSMCTPEELTIIKNDLIKEHIR
jgi:DNA-binding HxlR family transcriptional regulator